MANPTPGRFPANTSPIPEKSQSKDLDSIVTRIDEEWQELKEFLKTKIEQAGFDKEPDSHVYLTSLTSSGQEVNATGKTTEGHALPHNWVKFAVTPIEAEAIIERVGKFDQESKIMERLVKVERQNRRLSILSSIYFTLMVVFLLLASYFWVQIYTSEGPAPLSATKRIAPAAPGKAGEPAPTAQPTPKAPETPASVKPGETKPVSGEPQIPGDTSKGATPPAAREASALTSTPKAAEASNLKYVGSVTSNKYHLPSCKWAKNIVPKKARGFTSVAEAKKAGYVPCPTCQPPLADPADSQAKPQP